MEEISIVLVNQGQSITFDDFFEQVSKTGFTGELHLIMNSGYSGNWCKTAEEKQEHLNNFSRVSVEAASEKRAGDLVFGAFRELMLKRIENEDCLLYTSDAADE